MKKEEILEEAKSKKSLVGEMEKAKLNKSNWISVIVACCVALVLMIVEGIFRHYTAIYALALVCYVWAAVFYFCQYFLAKRPWPVLIGAVLDSAAAITMLVLLILKYAGVM